MLLSHNRLKRLVADGVITNVAPKQINAASIDITLGKKVLCECTPLSESRLISLGRKDKLTTFARDCTRGFVLLPGEFILAQSQQMFNLPNNISCEYKLKSSMARIGMDHALAGWCDAGWHGSVLTLELKNVTRLHSIELREGDAIGQMVFFEHEPVPADQSYAARGRYNNDTETTGVKG